MQQQRGELPGGEPAADKEKLLTFMQGTAGIRRSAVRHGSFRCLQGTGQPGESEGAAVH